MQTLFGTSLELLNQIKYMEVIINNKLNWSSHLVVQKAFVAICLCRRAVGKTFFKDSPLVVHNSNNRHTCILNKDKKHLPTRAEWIPKHHVLTNNVMEHACVKGHNENEKADDLAYIKICLEYPNKEINPLKTNR
ncbi:unnamed protein product [Brassicogethes aeneus]|uniref:Uncharacterized protein n=1 Tax=Brassicogethes aeneus TaxID=1431903 RepID=A0A9P0B6Q3_BRAAE|nr:unnamed protein product [Brassicogethes aeneus]